MARIMAAMMKCRVVNKQLMPNQLLECCTRCTLYTADLLSYIVVCFVLCILISVHSVCIM